MCTKVLSLWKDGLLSPEEEQEDARDPAPLNFSFPNVSSDLKPPAETNLKPLVETNLKTAAVINLNNSGNSLFEEPSLRPTDITDDTTDDTTDDEYVISNIAFQR